jgi:hypothetical protein
MHATDDLKIGKWYRLSFPGIAARVIEPPASLERTSEYCYLVESLVLRSRWWVNGRGEPDNIYSPHLIVGASDEGVIESARVALVGASEGHASGGKKYRSVNWIAKYSATAVATRFATQLIIMSRDRTASRRQAVKKSPNEKGPLGP